MRMAGDELLLIFRCSSLARLRFHTSIFEHLLILEALHLRPGTSSARSPGGESDLMDFSTISSGNSRPGPIRRGDSGYYRWRGIALSSHGAVLMTSGPTT